MSRLRTGGFCVALLLLLAARVDAAWITIAWDQNTEPDLAGYMVAYGTQSGRDDMVVSIGKTTNWTFTAAAVGTRYYFRVYAFNTAGLRSPASNEVTAVVLTTDTSGPVTLDHSSLSFAAVRAGVRVSTVYSPPQTVVLTPRASNTWSIKSSAGWLAVTPATGVGTGSFTASLRASSLPLAGSYTATITITAGESSVTLPVSLEVKAAGTTRAPLGAFDTPIDGSADVRGAVPVTGWAVDDVAVSKVQIFRDPVAGEAGQVYIGDATFVAGSRPDVEAGFAEWPLSYRAGWGFMLLTNMLPDVDTRRPQGGNGTFRLHAYALDAEGNTTVLGSKTIFVRNRGAIQPFGTIDTPAQGGTVSGAAYVNFGWAIAPAGMIPGDGSTLTVLIDGVPVGRPVYNQYREDIGTAFAGFANSSGPVGYYVLDTTKLSNGIHTIAWVVSDTAGNSAGLGSRYFNVLNDDSALTMASTMAVTMAAPSGAGEAGGTEIGHPADHVADLPVENQTVELSRTADVMHVAETVAPDWYGAIEVNTVEAEPIELRLAAQFADAGSSYDGYMVSNGAMRPLPLGSTLDAEKGVFSWQPGAAFVGTYEFVFLRTGNDGTKTRIPVRIVIAPPFDRRGIVHGRR